MTAEEPCIAVHIGNGRWRVSPPMFARDRPYDIVEVTMEYRKPPRRRRPAEDFNCVKISNGDRAVEVNRPSPYSAWLHLGWTPFDLDTVPLHLLAEMLDDVSGRGK